jgi:hypothetical protein
MLPLGLLKSCAIISRINAFLIHDIRQCCEKCKQRLFNDENKKRVYTEIFRIRSLSRLCRSVKWRPAEALKLLVHLLALSVYDLLKCGGAVEAVIPSQPN